MSKKPGKNHQKYRKIVKNAKNAEKIDKNVEKR